MEDMGLVEASVMQALDRLQATVVILSSASLDEHSFLSGVIETEENQAGRIELLLRRIREMESARFGPEAVTIERMIALFRILCDMTDNRAEVPHIITALDSERLWYVDCVLPLNWSARPRRLRVCTSPFGVWHRGCRVITSQVAQSTPVAVTIDLSQAGTTRGSEPSTAPVGVLPRRMVTAHVILANFSPGGNYVVSVNTDRTSSGGKVAGNAVAVAQGMHADLTVTLDLRGLPPGTYFFATTHQGDPASYFYPLAIR